MIISSRTPEGRPNRCPVCRAEVCVQPSEPPGDATCPQCGALLWYGAAMIEVTVVEFAEQIIDEATRRAFGERITQLTQAGRLDLLLDFSNVRWLSSPILGLLVHLKKYVGAHGGHVALCGLTPDLVRVFQITRLDRVLRIYRDQADAMRNWFED